MAKVGAVIAAVLAICGIGGVLFLESGYYDIGADDHDTKIVSSLFERLRDRSIEERAREIDVLYVIDPSRIADGAQRYNALCVGCHLAPGVTKSDLLLGLYPHPPELAREEMQRAQRAFWIIKHGIKMSAMPAWGKTLDDAAIWDIVAFIRKLPAMTPEIYQDLSRGPAEKIDYASRR